MSNYKKPTELTYPEWYRLGFDCSKMTIQITIYPQALDELWVDETGGEIRFDWGNQSWFPGFLTYQRVGFESLFVPVENRQNMWEVKIPRLSANNSAEESSHEYVSSLRSSLSKLFTGLSLFKGETDSQASQLLVVDSFLLGVGGGGAGLSAIITPSMSKLVEEHRDCLSQVKTDMMNANRYMWATGTPRDEFWFKAEYKSKRGLGLCVNSGARYLNRGEISDLKDNKGYEMHSHNIDGSLDQLTLLVGLCSLCQIVTSALH